MRQTCHSPKEPFKRLRPIGDIPAAQPSMAKAFLGTSVGVLLHEVSSAHRCYCSARVSAAFSVPSHSVGVGANLVRGLCPSLNYDSGRYSFSQSLSQTQIELNARYLPEPCTISSCTFRSGPAVLLIPPEPETSQNFISMLYQYHLRVRVSYFNLPYLVHVSFSFRATARPISASNDC
jgi:hypothetical protein